MCSGCGKPRDETMRNEEDIAGYDAEAWACHACVAREEAAAEFSGQKANRLGGIYFRVTERAATDSTT